MGNNIEELIFEHYKKSGIIQEYGTKIGPKVREVKFKGKNSFVGKFIKKELSYEEKMLEQLRGPNIIRVHKFCEPVEINGNKYCLIIIEKAYLRDLGYFNNYYHYRNLLKLIIPIAEMCEDNFLRFIMRQIVSGLEVLERNNYMDYNINPENLLITSNCDIKLSPFTDINGINKNISSINTNKKTLDYFGLGCTLFFLKFGKDLKEKIEGKSPTKVQIIKFIFKYINTINNNKTIDRDFIYFLLLLIKGGSDESLTFEEVYRNKWLNKNLECLEDIISDFEVEEGKRFLELNKHDFITKKNKIINYNAKRINKNLIKNNKEHEYNFKRKKFIFKKSIKYNLYNK